MRSCVHSLFIRIGGRGWGGSTSLSTALVAGREGLSLTDGEIELLSCVFQSSLFLTRVGMYAQSPVFFGGISREILKT